MEAVLHGDRAGCEDWQAVEQRCPAAQQCGSRCDIQPLVDFHEPEAEQTVGREAGTVGRATAIHVDNPANFRTEHAIRRRNQDVAVRQVRLGDRQHGRSAAGRVDEWPGKDRHSVVRRLSEVAVRFLFERKAGDLVTVAAVFAFEPTARHAEPTRQAVTEVGITVQQCGRRTSGEAAIRRGARRNEWHIRRLSTHRPQQVIEC